jgi:hypothetical protein
MSSPRIEFSRRAVRWLLPAAALALAPKCLACVLAYAGIATALGFGGPEMCGAPGDVTASWASLLAMFGLAVGAIGVFVILRHHRS